MLGLVVKSVPGIIIVGREHVPGLDTADEVVMTVEIPVAADLNEPGATAGATGHIAGDGNHATPSMLPNFAGGTLAGLSGLAIERIPGGVAISVERLSDRLIICPTGTTDQVGQEPLAIRRNDGHANVMMIVVWLGVYPVGRDLQIAGGPAAIRRTAVLVQGAEDDVVHPVTLPVEAVPSSVNNTLVEASNGSARAEEVLTSSIGKKDFPYGREGIRRVPIEWGMPLVLGCLAQAFVDAPLCQMGSSAVLPTGVGGIAHMSRCPMLDDTVGIRLYRVLTDRLPGS